MLRSLGEFLYATGASICYRCLVGFYMLRSLVDSMVEFAKAPVEIVVEI